MLVEHGFFKILCTLNDELFSLVDVRNWYSITKHKKVFWQWDNAHFNSNSFRQLNTANIACNTAVMVGKVQAWKTIAEWCNELFKNVRAVNVICCLKEKNMIKKVNLADQKVPFTFQMHIQFMTHRIWWLHNFDVLRIILPHFGVDQRAFLSVHLRSTKSYNKQAWQSGSSLLPLSTKASLMSLIECITTCLSKRLHLWEYEQK